MPLSSILLRVEMRDEAGVNLSCSLFHLTKTEENKIVISVIYLPSLQTGINYLM